MGKLSETAAAPNQTLGLLLSPPLRITIKPGRETKGAAASILADKEPRPADSRHLKPLLSLHPRTTSVMRLGCNSKDQPSPPGYLLVSRGDLPLDLLSAGRREARLADLSLSLHAHHHADPPVGLKVVQLEDRGRLRPHFLHRGGTVRYHASCSIISSHTIHT